MAPSVAELVRRKFPDCYFAHGMWCGPEFREAEILYREIESAIEWLQNNPAAISLNLYGMTISRPAKQKHSPL